MASETKRRDNEAKPARRAGGKAPKSGKPEIPESLGEEPQGQERAQTLEQLATTSPSNETGPAVISRHLRTLPNGPGVYRMYDTSGECLYVGKARSLKKRVASYARLGGHTNRIARMIAATADMEFVTTRTESEALLLEANLIKRLRPRFNVLMRDDKSFPYILIARDHAAPQILKHRGARSRKGDFFGPFASAGAVNRTINMLQRAFLLRTCSDAVYESRTRPCLLYQIKRCAAPCTGEISTDDYGRLVDEANQFLRGESKSVQDKLNELMRDAADKLEFERAAQYRNRLWALAHVQASSGITPQTVEEADVFAAHLDGGQVCIQVFFFRTGQNWGNRAYFPKADKSLPLEEILESFIAQFYDDKPVPRLILVSHEPPLANLLGEALSTKAQRKVEISRPQRGEKKELVDHAIANAKEALGRRLADSASQSRLLEGAARVFGLPRVPRRIEVYDNSHIQGTNAVGAMIVAGPQGFAKQHYRKFNMRQASGDDDFAMMREMLTRRFRRLLKERGGSEEHADAIAAKAADPQVSADRQAPAPVALETSSHFHGPRETIVGRSESDLHGEYGIPLHPARELRAPEALDGPTDHRSDGYAGDGSADDDGSSDSDKELLDPGELPEWPDLLLIDGGKGQLSSVVAVLEELGIHDVAVAGVAKGPDRDAGREHFHMPGREPFMLEPRDPVLYYVQRLRDEAHRFAIGSHRARRKKDIAANPLDEIAGIGPSRKRALLQHFGSAKSVSRAGIKDLQAVDGISAAMAQVIYDHFHEGRG